MKILGQRRIIYRIILPFTLLFGATLFSAWLVSSYVVSRFLNQNLNRNMVQAAEIISSSGYVMNPAILRQLKEVINADIVVSTADGRVIRSTFPTGINHEKISGLAAISRNGGQATISLKKGSKHYYSISRPVIMPGNRKAFISLWKSTRDFDRLRLHIIIILGAIALAGLGAMAWVGWLIARTITAPVEGLVRATESLAHGDRQAAGLPQGNDEIGRLGASFNRMVEQLRQAEKKLVETEKMAAAGQLAAGLAHEIRNPLTSIKMLGQVLKKRLAGQEDNQRLLDSLVGEISRLDRIIQELIDRARPGELKKEPLSVNPAVREILAATREQMIARKIVVREQLSETLPVVSADPGKVRQVLWNLVLNASEAMPRGGIIQVTTGIENDDCIRIIVEDTGVGIKAGERELVFEPFFTSKPEGMGLGLTISRKLIAAHGGELSLENRAGGGCRAVITLPVGGDKNHVERL